MSLIRGPFTLKYGPTALAGIDELDFTYEVDTDTFDTIQGNTYELSGGHQVAVTVTFLETDVPSLAVALPQYFVANGGTLSTGETVASASGAIDITPSDTSGALTTDLVITSSNGHILRVADCTTEIESISVDDKIRTVSVRFRGESTASTVQMFASGAVSIVS